VVGESSVKNCKPEGDAEKKNLPGLPRGVLGREIQPGHGGGFSCRAHAALLLWDGFHKNLHFWTSSGASEAERELGCRQGGRDAAQTQARMPFCSNRDRILSFWNETMQNVAGAEFPRAVQRVNLRRTLHACCLPSRTTGRSPSPL